jgi:serralysin
MMVDVRRSYLSNALPADPVFVLRDQRSLLSTVAGDGTLKEPLVGSHLALPAADGGVVDPRVILAVTLSGDPRMDGALPGLARHGNNFSHSFHDTFGGDANARGLFNEPWSYGSGSAWPAQQPIFSVLLDGQADSAHAMCHGRVESFSLRELLDCGASDRSNALPADRLFAVQDQASLQSTDPAVGTLEDPLASSRLLAPAADGSATDPLGILLVAPSGDPRIDGVLLGRAWNGNVLSYSFPDSSYDYEYPYGLFNEPWSYGSGSVWPAQQPIFRALFEGQAGGTSVMRYGSIESFSLLEFVDYGTGVGDIRIAISPYADPTAYAYYPADAGYGGDIWFGYSSAFSNPVLGDWGYFAHLHEAIHALGLKGGHEVGPLGTPALPYAWDSVEFTVGTYRSFVGAPVDGYRNETYGFPQTLMMLDIAALQYLYGADWGANAGNTTYRWDASTGEMTVNGVAQGRPGANRVFLTIWDGGGTDVYDMSNYASGVSIDLTPGRWSITSQAQRAQLNAYDGYVLAQGCIYNALQFGGSPQSLIENAIGGAGADRIVGNQGANSLVGGAGDDTLAGGGAADTLSGGDGADTLNGGTGTDSLLGGLGDDVYQVEGANDLIVEAADEGTDLVNIWAGTAYTLGANLENLALAGATLLNGSGNALANQITGNINANVLNGDAGADTLLGGDGLDTLDGGADLDSLVGGLATDTYMIDGDTPDTILELAGGGIDRVLLAAGTAYTLGTEVENLLLTGASALNGSGNSLANRIVGNGNANSLFGAAGADTIEAGTGNDTLEGGLGIDSLVGGADSDLYIVESQADVIVEVLNAGIDAVQATAGAAYTLGVNLEDLVLLGTVVEGNGNALANRITGNAASNILRGADGADTLDGSDGNDTLVGGNGSDTMIGGAGNDVFRLNAAAQSTTAAPDVISDFANTGGVGDRIELTLIDANPFLDGDQAFVFIGDAAFTAGQRGRLRYTDLGGGEFRIEGDIDGNAAADFAIRVTASAGPDAGWFIL